MKTYFGAIFAIVAKDALLEMRAKDILVSMLVFGLLTIVVFNFAIDPTPGIVAMVAPGILWVSFTFGGMLGLNRSIGVEMERGNLHALLLAPVGRDAVYFGKFLASLMFMLVMEAAAYPVFAVMFDAPLWLPGFALIALLASVGIIAVGVVFSAMAANTRSREVMLPALFLPVVVPALIAAVESTGGLMRPDADAELTRWIPFLLAYDAIFLTICPFAFSMIAEE